jgi:hypothetical protein
VNQFKLCGLPTLRLLTMAFDKILRPLLKMPGCSVCLPAGKSDCGDIINLATQCVGVLCWAVGVGFNWTERWTKGPF